MAGQEPWTGWSMPEPMAVEHVDFNLSPGSRIFVCAFHNPLIRGVRMIGLTDRGVGGILADGYLHLSYWRNKVVTDWYPDRSVCDDMLLVKAATLRSEGWQEVGTTEIDLETAMLMDDRWIRGVFMAAADEFAETLSGATT